MRFEIQVEQENCFGEPVWVLYADAVLSATEFKFVQDARCMDTLQIEMSRETALSLGLQSAFVEFHASARHYVYPDEQKEQPPALVGLSDEEAKLRLREISTRIGAKYAARMCPSLEWLVKESLLDRKRALLAAALKPDLVPVVLSLL